MEKRNGFQKFLHENTLLFLTDETFKIKTTESGKTIGCLYFLMHMNICTDTVVVISIIFFVPSFINYFNILSFNAIFVIIMISEFVSLSPNS